MRKLTVKRTKSFVGCLGKMKVYIEDSSSNEVVINNVQCRKLGTLKNGEEKTFEIDENAAKVFVIADKLSKNYCNDYYELSEGADDVFLSGKNKYNPAAGNPFRFDNNNSEGAAANRKRGFRKGLAVLIAAVMVGAVVGFCISSGIFSDKTPKEKRFSCEDMRITLTNEFQETSAENYLTAYGSKDVAVFVIKEDFSLAEELKNYSLLDYADLVIETNQLPSSEAEVKDGQITFTHKSYNSKTNQTYHYHCYVYKSSNAFWLIQFAVSEENIDKYQTQIAEWASSVGFALPALQ